MRHLQAGAPLASGMLRFRGDRWRQVASVAAAAVIEFCDSAWRTTRTGPESR
ncbi:MAG: hypothetical protein M0030_13580 [Actinomycetota bacterium]|nr:hypothetical protein [Actinomycetota bacterium]